MSKFKVGDVVSINDDGAWIEAIDEPDIDVLDHDLQGTTARVVAVTEGAYTLELMDKNQFPFNLVTMERGTADDTEEYLELYKPTTETKPIKSDGCSSSYYDIPLPEWLVGRIIDRQSDGQAFIKTEEIITVAFGNDFDYGNLFKSEVRAWGAMNGAGKEGNSVGYELNKMRYSIDKIQEAVERGE